MSAAAAKQDVIESDRQRAWRAAAAVCDPEVPVLTIEDLGVLRSVELEDASVTVEITPTYSGCPAMNTIALDVEVALEKAGFSKPVVKLVHSPAWTTDWMNDAAREKLRVFGIAPPAGSGSRGVLFGIDEIACPKCGSVNTRKISEFGSTACKAHYTCNACFEPFDYFKCI